MGVKGMGRAGWALLLLVQLHPWLLQGEPWRGQASSCPTMITCKPSPIITLATCEECRPRGITSRTASLLCKTSSVARTPL